MDKKVFQIALKYVQENGLVAGIIKDFTKFSSKEGVGSMISDNLKIDWETDLHMAMVGKKRIENKKDRPKFKIEVNYELDNIKKPSDIMLNTNKMKPLMPSMARLNNKFYGAEVFVIVHVKITNLKPKVASDLKNKNIKTAKFKISIGKIPVMKKSSLCQLYGKTKKELLELGEDPDEPGGLFIAKSNEYGIINSENILYNNPQLHKRTKSDSVTYRIQIIGRRYGRYNNSYYNVLEYTNKKSITFELSSTKIKKGKDTKSKDRGNIMPFYVLFWLFGVTNDLDMAKYILGINSLENLNPIQLKMIDMIRTARFSPEYKKYVDLKYIGTSSARDIQTQVAEILLYADKEKRNDKYKKIMNILDENVLANVTDIGLGDINSTKSSDLEESKENPFIDTIKIRKKKLIMIGKYINRLLLGVLGLVPITNRDSTRYKSYQGANDSIMKIFKSSFHQFIIKKHLKTIETLLSTHIDTFNTITDELIMNKLQKSTNPDLLTDKMVSIIYSGFSDENRFSSEKRITSNRIEWKNRLNVISALTSTDTTSNGSKVAKGTQSNFDARKVHGSYVGYIDITASADTGEKVGRHKQLTLLCSITPEINPSKLLKILSKDKDIINILYAVDNWKIYDNLSSIYVNGDLIGYTETKLALFTSKYIKYRREGSIQSKITIAHDIHLNTINFMIIAGRLCKPLMIVNSNIEEFDRKKGKIKFAQFIKEFKNKDKFNDLVKNGVIEYITPQEQVNLYVAPSLQEFELNKNNIVKQYTHVEIPINLFGLSSLVTIFANHTQAVRTTFSNNHSKQGTGQPNIMYKNRFDQNFFHQFYIDKPIITTIANYLTVPNSSNVITISCAYTGNNQEDSVIINKASVDRGLFAGSFYKVIKIKIEKGQKLFVPGNKDVILRRAFDGLDKLDEEGIIKIGSRLQKGDTIAGIAVVESNGQDRDISHINKDISNGIVENIHKYNDRGIPVILIKIRYDRKLVVGDKLAVRIGNKTIAGQILPTSKMPFTKEGLIPDLIFNIHTIPTRMVVAQLIETALTNIQVKKGEFINGTNFTKLNLYEMQKDLIRCGFRKNGRKTMYNGFTGMYMNTAIDIGANTVERLPKFVTDISRCSGLKGEIDPLTGQPKKTSKGVFKLGEMEKWVLDAQGSMLMQKEKLKQDSDGTIAYVCRNCNNLGRYNNKLNIYNCELCQFPDLVKFDTRKSCITMKKEVEGSGIQTQYICAKNEQFIYE